MSQISGHEPQEQPIFLVQSLLHPLARLCPENAHSGLGLAGTRSMCFSPVEISPLWWCLTWVCDLLSPLGNHLEPLLTFPFPLFVSSACETQVCCRTWRGEVWAMLTVWAIACLGIWGFYPPPIKLSADQILLPHQSLLCADLKSATTALRVLKDRGEDQRETLCRLVGLPVHFRARPGETPKEEVKVHWDRLQCQGYVFLEAPLLHSLFYNEVTDYVA